MMRATARRTIQRVITVVLGLLLLSLVVLFLPPVADHFGYARPVPGGLPTRFSLYGVGFQRNSGCFAPMRHGRCPWALGLATSLPVCPSANSLQKRHLWPLEQIGTLPTIFGSAHPVFDVLGPFSGGPAYGVVLVKDGSCYLPYKAVRR